MQKIPAGYKKTEVGVIPEDWDVKSLGDCLIRSPRYGIGAAAVEYSDRLPKYIRITDISENGLFFPKKTVSVDNPFSANYFLSEGDLVVARTGASVGKSYLYRPKDGPLVFAGFLICLSPQKKTLHPQYLSNYCKSKSYWNWVKLTSMRSGQPGINGNEYAQLLIPLPKIPEQTAIATVLSDNDALIEKLEKLIAKKKAIKQGAMQQLLTGKKRLPGFRGEWEVKKLGEICEIKKGQLITDRSRIEGNIPVIAGGKVPAYFHNKANRNGKTITISASGASAGYVAYHTYPIFASDCSSIEESKKYTIEFIYFLLQSKQEKIYKMQTGGAQPHIHPSDLTPINVSMPKKEEQTAIATVLSDMEAEIERLEQKLDKYRQIKTGMMQQLLTGKIRLGKN